MQEEHERALEALRESKEAEFNALRETQRDLERRLDEKNQQCRRVEEEAAALKAKLLQSADARAQWLNEKINSLEKEVESLNAVLEMKVAENRELLAEKRENQDRKERMALMQEALDKQRAKIEDLKVRSPPSLDDDGVPSQSLRLDIKLKHEILSPGTTRYQDGNSTEANVRKREIARAFREEGSYNFSDGPTL